MLATNERARVNGKPDSCSSFLQRTSAAPEGLCPKLSPPEQRHHSGDDLYPIASPRLLVWTTDPTKDYVFMCIYVCIAIYCKMLG